MVNKGKESSVYPDFPVHVITQGNHRAEEGKFLCRDIFLVTNEERMSEYGQFPIPNVLVSLCLSVYLNADWVLGVIMVS